MHVHVCHTCACVCVCLTDLDVVLQTVTNPFGLVGSACFVCRNVCVNWVRACVAVFNLCLPGAGDHPPGGACPCAIKNRHFLNSREEGSKRPDCLCCVLWNLKRWKVETYTFADQE